MWQRKDIVNGSYEPTDEEAKWVEPGLDEDEDKEEDESKEGESKDKVEAKEEDNEKKVKKMETGADKLAVSHLLTLLHVVLRQRAFDLLLTALWLSSMCINNFICYFLSGMRVLFRLNPPFYIPLSVVLGMHVIATLTGLA